MKNKNIYYDIHLYGRHVAATTTRPDINVYRVGTYSQAEKLVVDTGGKKGWERTLDEADCINEFLGFFSERFIDAASKYIDSRYVQLIPLVVNHKDKEYNNFYALNPLVQVNIVDPISSFWREMVSSTPENPLYLTASFQHYNDNILEEIYAEFPHIHFSKDPIVGPMFVSNEIRKLINREKLKVRAVQYQPSTNVYRNNDCISGKDVTPQAWIQKVKETVNYEFLKEKFGWE